jgi:PAS domain S-box-containing protein
MLRFLEGGGEMGALMRSHDWSATSLGTPERWPQPLRTAIRLLLNAGHPMYVWWGPDLLCFYNDAYSQSIGPEMHPGSLGQPAHIVWREIWDLIRPEIDQVMSGGGATWHENALVPITRNGQREDVYWTYSYGPIDDPRAPGGIGGVLVLCTETTPYVAMAQSQERFRSLVSATSDIVYRMSPDWTEMWPLNGRAVLPDGQSPPVARINDYILADDRPRMLAELQAAIDAKGVFQMEHRVRQADGTVGYYLSRAIPLLNPGGRITEWFGAASDVTEARSARDALSRSEERYRALFEAIDDGFCIIEFIDGPDGPLSDYVHVEANLGYERQTGIAGVVGQTIRGFAPAEAGAWVELYGAVLRTGQPIRFERFFEAAGRHIEVSAARVEPAGRRQVSVLFRDISPRKQAEEALRVSEALARENVQRVQLALGAGAIIGTWNWDLPTNRFAVDEPFARAFGLDPQLGRNGLSLAQVVATVHPDDQAGLADAIKEAIERGGAYAHQYRVRRADGKYYWIEANGRVDHAPDGTPLSFPGVLIDVEERRAVAEERDRATADLRRLNETLEQRVAERTAELIRAEAQLRQSQKMEAVGQLTGGLAHDFNNLLTGITGSLELMAARISQGRLHDLDRYIIAAEGAAKRAASLTHRLLAFSRQQTLAPKATNVNNLVSGMLDLVQRTVGPGIQIEMVGMSGLWSTRVDPSQLESALLNLCINARDAMPQGGKITIETSNRWIDREGARRQDMQEGQYLSLCVSDTGTGMSPDVIEKAFDPFFTTKPIGQGTGLGLSMIYGFAKQSGGQVRIYSEVGKGAMVCIYLPRHRGETEEEQETSATVTSAPAQEGEVVLIVDDEPTVRLLVVDLLEELGYVVIEANDSASGLRVLQSGARIDLVVTDVGLPGGMNGRQMVDVARVGRPRLKALFITGFAENALLNNGQLEPGMSVLTKPFALDVLAARVRELIAK